MADVKDPAIKLFGATIPLGHGGGEDGKDQSDNSDHGPESKDRDQESPTSEEKSERPNSTASEDDAPKPLESEEGKKDASNLPEKQPLKKPDKILPCPRCNSLDTKFCYYNNYNVNQPRHFCKNCQRYWTAGGTMRNVPVGAGRRKSKNSHTRNITVTAVALQTLGPDAPESIHHFPVKPNGTVLTFGPDMPFCESMASVLNLAEKSMNNCSQNGFHQTEEKTVRFPAAENGDELSSGSSVTGSNSNDEGVGTTSQEQMLRNCQAFPTPWPYPWAPPPPFCAPSFPVPFYPVPYWGCPIPGAWTVPWIASLASPPANGSYLLSGSSCSGPNSPTLGKHSREGIVLKHSNSETGVAPEKIKDILVPKTLRIDDPEVAAKSSIWASIGIKNDKANGISSGGLFKAFQNKTTEIKERMPETSQILHANPAALSRSLNFQEIL